MFRDHAVHEIRIVKHQSHHPHWEMLTLQEAEEYGDSDSTFQTLAHTLFQLLFLKFSFSSNLSVLVELAFS